MTLCYQVNLAKDIPVIAENYTQRQRLSTTYFVAKFFRARLHIKINASYRDNIVKHSCYFAIVCYGEFKKKHIGVRLFSLRLCVHE